MTRRLLMLDTCHDDDLAPFWPTVMSPTIPMRGSRTSPARKLWPGSRSATPRA